MQLLAALRETRLDDAKEAIALSLRQCFLFVDIDAQDRGVDLRSRIERLRRYLRHDARLPIELYANGQEAKLSRLRDDALRHLVLNHNHHQPRRIRALQKMTKRWRRNVIWEVCYQFIRSLRENLSGIQEKQIARKQLEVAQMSRCLLQESQHVS